MSVEVLLEQSRELSPILPGLIRAAAVALAFSALWLIASIPAYWLAQALEYRVAQLLEYLGTIGRSVATSSRNLLTLSRTPIEHFVQAHAQVLRLDAENDAIVRSINSIASNVKALPTRLTQIESEFGEARTTVEKSLADVSRIEYPAEISLPSPHDFASVQAAKNHAALKTTTFAVIAPILIAINTLMLNEFFSVFFPPLRLWGIQLALIGACLFSLVEFTFGATLAFIDGHAPAQRLFRIGIGALILLLGLIEFVFYAEFGQDFDSNPFGTLFAPDSVGESISKLWFGVLGPIVVFGVAVSGHTLVRGFRSLADNYIVAQWQSHLRDRVSTADALHKNLVSATHASKNLLLTIQEAQSALGDDREASFAGALNKSRAGLTESIEKARDVRLAETRILERSEMFRLYWTHIFLATVAALATGLFAAAYGPRGIALNWGYLPTVVAITEALVLVAAGFLATRIGRHVQSSTRPTEAAYRLVDLLPFVTIVVLLAIILGNAFLILQRISPFNLMWFSTIVSCCLFLYFCGLHLGMILAAVWTSVETCAVFLSSVVVFCVAGLIQTLRTIVHLVRFVLRALAYPYEFVFRRRRETNIERGVRVS